MYVVLFGVGVVFVVVSLLLGELGDFEGLSFSFLRPTLIAIFITVMGGLGLLLTPILDFYFGGAGIVLAISAVGGFVIAALVNRFIIVPLQKAQNTSTFNIQDTIGISAEVISKIPQGGYGKIRYSISGSVVTSPAKSDNGNEIKSGEKVDIVYVDKNTYFVKKFAKQTFNNQL